MTPNFLTSACRYCRYYKLEGRRGGMCQLLGVPVQGSWKACTMAIPPFSPSWEDLEGMIILPNEMPILSDVRSLGASDIPSLAPTKQEKPLLV